MSGIGRLGINPDAFGVWRADDPANTPWAEFLDGASDAGYEMVELGPPGYLPADPAERAHELSSRGLTLSCGYLPVAFDDPTSVTTMDRRLDDLAAATPDADYVLALARADWGPTGRVAPDEAHWRALTTGLVRLSDAAEDRHGKRLVFHPHVGMAVETEAEIERLIDDTDGRVALCLDVGQHQYVGGDPARFLRDHADRVAYLHLRDVDPVLRDACVADGVDFATAAARDVFCEPGDGCVDLAAVAAAAAAARFDGPVIVERSYLGRTPQEAKAAAVRAAAHHRALGFG